MMSTGRPSVPILTALKEMHFKSSFLKKKAMIQSLRCETVSDSAEISVGSLYVCVYATCGSVTLTLQCKHDALRHFPFHNEGKYICMRRPVLLCTVCFVVVH